MSYCPECGVDHHAGERTGIADEVRIAKINADRDIEVARISRGEFVKTAEIAAETDVITTELETAAAVEVAAELADGGAPAAEEPETQAIVVEGPPAEPSEPESTVCDATCSGSDKCRHPNLREAASRMVRLSGRVCQLLERKITLTGDFSYSSPRPRRIKSVADPVVAARPGGSTPLVPWGARGLR